MNTVGNTKEYTREEVRIFKRLNSPQKIQDYVDTLLFNFEKNGDTNMSPRCVLREGKAQCFEGSLFAAAVLEFHGEKPLILDLRSSKRPWDYDHVVTVFKRFGCFGAISKTNHAVLRYREPVYRTLRELAMSYFHEYFLNKNGQKTLREYSNVIDLNTFNNIQWRTTEENLYEITEYLDTVRHHILITHEQIHNLRKADNIEIEAGKMVEYERDDF